MRTRLLTLFAAGLILAATGLAKNKKPVLPAYVLTARTVAVIIDPSAGIAIDDPRANQVAQKDVEAALLNWGRFEPVINTHGADLIIVVRKGSGRLAQPTISDPRQNDRLGSVVPFDNGASIGAQQGRPPSSTTPADQTPHPETQIGSTDDSFAVYRGDVDDPLNSAPAWRYTASDALQSPSVPAVDKFRQAVADAEKAVHKGP